MLDINFLKEKSVGIYGFGKEGIAVANYLLKNGLFAHVFDSKDRNELDLELVEKFEGQGFKFFCGESFLGLNGVEVVFRSPGVRSDDIYLARARESGVVITSQTKYFFDNCKADIIGVTGTKGKGTTSTLIYEILKSVRSESVYLTGNIGKDDPLDLMEKLEEGDLVVFELSSFQLEDLSKSPKYAVCLMVTSEHLDYHINTQKYIEAKSNIAKFQNNEDFLVFARDYPGSCKIASEGSADKVSYGSTMDTNENGVTINGSKLIFRRREFSGELDFSERRLIGAHNLENIAAAILTCLHIGINYKDCYEVARTFSGLEHRLEVLPLKGSYKFVNDSFSTTPESTIAALSSFTEPVDIILGGADKKSDFSILVDKLCKMKNVKSIFLIGHTSERLYELLNNAGFSGYISKAEDLEHVFNLLKDIIKSGDIILLSPACASFGLFKNYKERGQVFKRLARDFVEAGLNK